MQTPAKKQPAHYYIEASGQETCTLAGPDRSKPETRALCQPLPKVVSASAFFFTKDFLFFF